MTDWPTDARACLEHQFPEEETPDGRRVAYSCLCCGLPVLDAMTALSAERDAACKEVARIKEWDDKREAVFQRVIEHRNELLLRELRHGIKP